jgi:hypothetical protein
MDRSEASWPDPGDLYAVFAYPDGRSPAVAARLRAIGALVLARCSPGEHLEIHAGEGRRWSGDRPAMVPRWRQSLVKHPEMGLDRPPPVLPGQPARPHSAAGAGGTAACGSVSCQGDPTPRTHRSLEQAIPCATAGLYPTGGIAGDRGRRDTPESPAAGLPSRPAPLRATACPSTAAPARPPARLCPDREGAGIETGHATARSNLRAPTPAEAPPRAKGLLENQ